jgi:hypothetical protein
MLEGFSRPGSGWYQWRGRSKVVAREGAVGMLGFVEHWDVWLDPVLTD